MIVGADGAMVRDSEGNELIDGIGGLWCVNAGHRRKEIIDAITEQLNELDFYSTFYNFHPSDGGRPCGKDRKPGAPAS